MTEKAQRILYYLTVGLIVFVSAAHAETRAAFVVGNSAYENAPALANPARDARLVADTLRSLEFEVTRHQDLTRDGFADALGAFLRTHRDADVTFFYFAGHGMQYEGQNYLVGTDAELRSELDIDSETIELAKVVDLLERNSKAALVFVDACRDNPLAEDFYRRNFSETRALETRGLTRMRTRTDGSMLVFAAAPGQVAYDGAGRNSPFATALAKHLPTEGAEILSLTKRIIGDVRNATDGRQSPIVTNDLTQEIFLREAALAPGVGGPSSKKQTKAVDAVEDELFKAAKILRTPRAWAKYFDEYPEGAHREEALELEAVHFREELNERAIDRFVTFNRDVGKSELANEALKRLGLSRVDIIAMQAVLAGQGYDTGAADGAFGSKTIAALENFQSHNGLKADGVPDRPTLSALGLRTRSGNEVDRFPIAGQVNRRHHAENAGLIEEDQRLAAVMREFGPSYITYGYFEDRLYVALKANIGRWSWDMAVERAERAGGHLATIGSKSENDFIVELIRYDETFWNSWDNRWISGPSFGLKQRDGAREPAGGWHWYNGEASGFESWIPGFPNNNNNRAKYGAFGHHHPSVRASRNFWGWDDYELLTHSVVIEVP